MASRKEWQNLSLENHETGRSTKKLTFEDWKPHANAIKEWLQDKKSAKEILLLLANVGFDAKKDQLSHFMGTAGLRRPNRRTIGVAQLTHGRQISSCSPRLEQSKSALGDYSSLFDEMEGLEKPVSGSDEFPRPAEILPTGQQPESFTGATYGKMIPFCGLADPGVTLLSSAKVSPEPSLRSVQMTYQFDSMSLYGLSERSWGQGSGSIRHSLSSRSSVTVEDHGAILGIHEKWRIYSHNDVAWSEIVQVGRVLDVLDQLSNGPYENSLKRSDGRSRKRRFVVVGLFQDGFCGLPVRTYRNRGVSGHADQQIRAHAVLHVKGTAPKCMPEEPQMTKKPLSVRLSSKVTEWSPASRINFCELRTIGTNSAVRKIGKIDSSSMHLLEPYWYDHLKTEHRLLLSAAKRRLG